AARLIQLREGGWTLIRTVGVTLRRTAGGGVIVALGLGALSTGPHQLAPVSAAGIALPVTALPLTGATTGADPPRPAPAPSVVPSHVDAGAPPAAAAAPPRA